MKIYRPKGLKTIQNKEIPETSGIYFLWSKKELLYIGKAKNLRRRIAEHFSNGIMLHRMVNPDLIVKVSLIETMDEFDALRLEETLLDLIPTKFNKKPFYQSPIYQDWKYKEGMYSPSFTQFNRENHKGNEKKKLRE